MVLDKSEQHFLEDRVEAIRTAYKKITNRDIEIEFQKESTFYTLKKGEKKWTLDMYILILGQYLLGPSTGTLQHKITSQWVILGGI